jgi:predicted PurR-regulated permease PerM
MSQTSPQSSDPRSLIRYACVALAVTVTLAWALYLVRSTLLLVYVSALFATGIAPLVQTIERQRFLRVGKRHLPRGVAILVIYAAVIGALAGLIAAILPAVTNQLQEFWKALPAHLDELQTRLVSWGLMTADGSFKELIQRVPANGGDVAGVAFAALGGVLGGIVGLISILLLTFYLLVEADDLLALFVRLFPRRQRQQVSAISAMAAKKISAWLSGQALLGLIIGVASAVGFALMGVPYFFVLAVIAAIGEMIPMVGPVLSAIPAVAAGFTVSPSLGLGVGLYCLALQQLENHVLVPKVMGQSVGLSAVTVIVSLAIGSELLGVVGALLAVPTAAIIQVLFEELYLSEKDPA